MLVLSRSIARYTCSLCSDTNCKITAIVCIVYAFVRWKYAVQYLTFVFIYIVRVQKAPFKAQPLPDFGLLPDLPPKAPPHNIVPKPFALQTDIRGEVHTVKQQEKVRYHVAGFISRDAFTTPFPQ